MKSIRAARGRQRPVLRIKELKMDSVRLPLETDKVLRDLLDTFTCRQGNMRRAQASRWTQHQYNPVSWIHCT